jgi:alkaline phosphatase D
LFPSLGLGRDNDIPLDESRREDGRQQSTLFDPIDFNKNNYNLTDKDTAWFYMGNAGAVMDDYTATDDESTLREEFDSTVPIAMSRSSRNHPRGTAAAGGTRRHHRNTTHRRKEPPRHYQLCDTTTIALLVLCTVLTVILAVLVVALHPFRNTNAINGSSNGIASNTTMDNDDFSVPTVTPAVTSRADPPGWVYLQPTVPTRYPTGIPSSNPTARPTAFVPRIPPTAESEPVENENAKPMTSSGDNSDSNNKVNKLEVPPLSMGPLVGHTTHDSVTLWAYHEFVNDTMEILLYDYATDELVRTVGSVAPRRDRNRAMIHTVSGLRASTSYKFGLHVRGERVGKGSFTTAPLPSNPNGTRFDYILASCMNHRQYKNQIVWDVIVEQLGGKYPDFSILAGDTVYLQEGVDVTTEDGVKFDRVWFRNQEQRREPHFARFVSHVPTYATWNDHEYGKNNANKDQKGKTNSLRAWESLWANPGYGDETTDDGVYYSYYWGDVHYIVTDDHWYRDPKTKNRLGIKQTEWIRDELVNSKGTFKVIVIGSDIMERGWSSDLNNIGDIVREQSINGVLFHAGDIHRNEYKEHITGGFPYPVKQITSSGIAKVWRRPFVHIRVDTELRDPTVTAFFYGASSTADLTTWTNDPSLVCSKVVGVDRTKEHTCTETIHLSELTVPLR